MSAVPSAELLHQWTICARNHAGAQLCIRPLQSNDREREIAFINGLSEQSRYFRLLTPFKFLPPHLVDQLMDVDYENRMAFVATIPTSSGEEIVGIARYGKTDQAGVAELGISVADAWHRTGIARQLVTILLRYAEARGISRMTGIVLPDNAAMIALARGLGFTIAYDPAQHLMTIARELPGGRGETRGRCGEVTLREDHPAD